MGRGFLCARIRRFLNFIVCVVLCIDEYFVFRVTGTNKILFFFSVFMMFSLRLLIKSLSLIVLLLTVVLYSIHL